MPLPHCQTGGPACPPPIVVRSYAAGNKIGAWCLPFCFCPCGDNGRSADGVAVVLYPNYRQSHPAIKSGHCRNQIRPLRVETGLSRPPLTLRSCVVSEALAIAPRSQRHVCQILWLARSLLLQSSRMSPFRRPVSAAKNSVPDSSIGDWFR